MSQQFEPGDVIVSEEYHNKGPDRPSWFGSSEAHTAWTDDPLRIFESCRSEYGFFQSILYTEDAKSGESVPCGWTFVQRLAYDDCRYSKPREKNTYVREVFVYLETVDEDGERRPLEVPEDHEVYRQGYDEKEVVGWDNVNNYYCPECVKTATDVGEDFPILAKDEGDYGFDMSCAGCNKLILAGELNGLSVTIYADSGEELDYLTGLDEDREWLAALRKLQREHGWTQGMARGVYCEFEPDYHS